MKRISRASLLPVMLTSIALFGSACTSAKSSQSLRDSFSSPEELARATLGAIYRKDEAALRKLQVTEQEYRDVIWAALPPEEVLNFEVETAWEWVQRDADKAIRRIFYDYGGRPLRLIRTYIQHETREYPSLKVIRGLRMVVEDEITKQEEDIKLLNVVAEKNGRFKVIAFDT